MKIFIFEDDGDRIRAFYKVLKDKNEIDTTDNIETAKMLLSKNEYDVAFLDHDMDHQSYVSSDEPNTGYQVAKFIVEKNIPFHQVFVHSMNPVGAENIMNELNKSLFITELHRTPFPTLLTLLKGI